MLLLMLLMLMLLMLMLMLFMLMLRLREEILEHRGWGAPGSREQCCDYGGTSWNTEAGEL